MGADQEQNKRPKKIPMAIGALNSLVISNEYVLTSTFAQEQLIELARQLSEAAFTIGMVSTFGIDVPAEAYQKLYRNASDEAIENPFIYVCSGLVDGHLAGFNSKTREIYISDVLVEDAIKDNESRAKLMAALLEEYGHYIDYILRNEYSDVAGDAEGDEGAVFSYRLLLWSVVEQSEINFSHLDSIPFTGDLVLDNADLSSALASVDASEQAIDDKIEDFEFFGAGLGDTDNPASYGHQSIEHVLGEIGFIRPTELPRIYYGNWLRDFSQMVDPKIVRPDSQAARDVQGSATPSVLDSLRLSRKAITRFVALLAAKEFGQFDKTWAKSIYQDLTPEVLGVYRPEEHIDNPKGIESASHIDPDFVDAPTPRQLEIDDVKGMKNYIATPLPLVDQSFPTSIEYMTDQLEKAVTLGRNNQGLLHFGQALHVLEDFYSHSNFVELAIIKLGESGKFSTPELNELAKKVQPRVEIQPPLVQLPLVTGRFGQFDILASVGPKFSALFDITIEEYLSNKASAKAMREQADLAILIVLEDLAEAQKADVNQDNEKYLGIDFADVLADFKWFIGVRDELLKKKEESVPGLLLKMSYYLVSFVMAIANTSMYLLTEIIAHHIDDAQTILDETGTDPTHSQLAKDHDDHPLHELAALLAMSAVRRVGESVMSKWLAWSLDADPVAVAQSYFVHPDTYIEREDIIIKWANEHKDKLLKATFASVVDETHHHYEELKGKLNPALTDLYKQYQKVRSFFQ